MTPHLRSFVRGLAVATLLCLVPALRGQDGELRQFDPSDVYFQAWLKIREAEKAEEEEKFLAAFEHYKKAASLFDTVGVYHPNWKPHLVKDRQETTRASMDEIREKALREQAAADAKVEGLVEGPGVAGNSPAVGIRPLTPAEQRDVASLQRQIANLQGQLRNVANDRDANAAQLRRALKDLETRRNDLARAPLQGEVEQLNDRIGQLQRDKEALAIALRKSQEEQERTAAQAKALEQERNQALAKVSEFENKLTIQNNASAKVIRGLRDQLKEVKAIAAEKDRLYARANQQISELSRQLKESHAEIADLKEERGELLKERDHMAQLLKLNETDRVKLLIEQNMQLGQQLNEARDKLAEVAADNNRTAQELVAAKSQLAVAKAKIIQINNEHSAQAKRLAELEARLREEGAALASVEGGESSREEVTVLQGIIDRTLKVQSRRRKAQELLVETIRRKAIEDPEVWGALEMLGGQEVELTEEETRLVADRTIDGEFVFSNPTSPEERAQAQNELQRSIGMKSNLARRAFSNGRFLVARELFESILEEHPGHVTTKVNLGVVHLRNDDPALAIQSFEDVLTLRPDMPYAHFMLGVSHYEVGDYTTARTELKEAVEGDPTNAKAHVFIGSIAAVLGEIGDAENHWQEAIKIDPTLSGPYYNLAILRAREGRKKEGLELYRKALDNGREPDFELEKQLGS